MAHYWLIIDNIFLVIGNKFNKRDQEISYYNVHITQSTNWKPKHNSNALSDSPGGARELHVDTPLPQSSRKRDVSKKTNNQLRRLVYLNVLWRQKILSDIRWQNNKKLRNSLTLLTTIKNPRLLLIYCKLSDCSFDLCIWFQIPPLFRVFHLFRISRYLL